MIRNAPIGIIAVAELSQYSVMLTVMIRSRIDKAAEQRRPANLRGISQG